MSKAIRAAIGYTLGNYLIKGLVFLTIPIFSRLLSTSDYGIYNTYLAYENIISFFISLAVFMSLKNAKYDFGEKYSSYVSSILVIQIISFLGALLLATFGRNSIRNFTGMNYDVLVLLLIQSLGTGVLSVYNAHVGLSYSYKKYIQIAAFNSIGNIGISLILILSIFNDQRALGRIIGTVIPYFFIILYVWQYFFRQARPRISKFFWSYALIFSLPLIPHAISQVILNQFDRIMISQMVGISEAGIYSFAYNILAVIIVIMASVDNVWGPWFYQKMHDGDEKAIKKESSNYIIGMLFLCLVVLLISPELIKLLGPKSYWDSVYCVVPLVMAGYFTFLYTIPCQVEYYHRKTIFIAFGTFLAAIVNIVMNYIFITIYGYIAAAYTTFVAYILYFFFHYLLAKHIEGRQLFDTKVIIQCSMILVIIGILAISLVQVLLIRYIILILVMACACRWGKKYFTFDDLKKKWRGKK